MKKTVKRILIAGGAGFLGSHLCESLLREGHQVVCVDNFFTGSIDNFATFAESPAFQWIRHDICEPLDLQGIDEIYNFACPASPMHYQADPIQTLKTSVQGTLNLLQLARRTGATLFQASTSEVYGDPLVHPQVEDYWGHVNPIGIRSCYDEGKRCAETLLFDSHRMHQIPIKVGRIFNTYGPRMHPQDGRVVSNFIVQALRNEPLTIYGDGSQTRSFCYVDDLIEAVVRMMATPVAVTGPINLGNPVEYCVLDLARQVLELTGSRSQLIFQPLPADDPKQRRPDISKARAYLGWQPATPLTEGLKATISYFAEILGPLRRSPGVTGSMTLQ
jgi:UDP-glucuronate decarboxylase